jgi:hypothetical protein
MAQLLELARGHSFEHVVSALGRPDWLAGDEQHDDVAVDEAHVRRQLQAVTTPQYVHRATARNAKYRIRNGKSKTPPTT